MHDSNAIKSLLPDTSWMRKSTLGLFFGPGGYSRKENELLSLIKKCRRTRVRIQGCLPSKAKSLQLL